MGYYKSVALLTPLSLINPYWVNVSGWWRKEKDVGPVTGADRQQFKSSTVIKCFGNTKGRGNGEANSDGGDWGSHHGGSWFSNRPQGAD